MVIYCQLKGKMEYTLKTPIETSKDLSVRLKELRLLKNSKRSTLAKRSGVTESSFEPAIQYEKNNRPISPQFLAEQSRQIIVNEVNNCVEQVLISVKKWPEYAQIAGVKEQTMNYGQKRTWLNFTSIF